MNRRQKRRISGAPSRWVTVAGLRSSCRCGSCAFGRKATSFSCKRQRRHSRTFLIFDFFLILCPGHVPFYDYIPHCGLHITPELGLIVIHLHLPCHKLQVPFLPPSSSDSKCSNQCDSLRSPRWKPFLRRSLG